MEKGGYEEIWNLVSHIRTNPIIYSGILSLDSIGELQQTGHSEI